MTYFQGLSDEIDFAVTLGIFSGVTRQMDMLDIIEVDYDCDLRGKGHQNNTAIGCRLLSCRYDDKITFCKPF